MGKNTPADPNATPSAPNPGEESTTALTQERVNALVAEARRKTEEKYADYADLKAKAEQFDKTTEATKTEAQKALERAQKAEAEAAKYQRQLMAAEVAAAKGVPIEALHGETREDIEALADKLNAWRGEATPSVAVVPRSGTGAQGVQPGSVESGRQRARARREQKNNRKE